MIHLSNRPKKLHLASAVVLATAFALAYHLTKQETLSSIYLPAFLGVGSLAVQGLVLTWSDPAGRKSAARALAIGAIFPLFLFFTAIGLAVVDQLNPKTYDHFLYVFDQSLGFVPSFAAGRLLESYTPLAYICYYAYEFLPLAMSLAFVLDKNSASRWSPNLLSVFVTVGLWGYLGYHLYPATGPIHVWPDQFPWHPLQPGTVLLEKSLVPPASRNAMPSLHLGMALVIWLASRNWRIWWRALSAALVVLVALATLGFGEHYLIDLVVAVPFVVSARAWCTQAVRWGSPSRSLPAFGGALLTIGWLVLLRVGVPLFEHRPFLAWMSIILTVGLPLWWEARLARFAARSARCFDAFDATLEPEVRPPFGLVGATE
ncbi:MAG: phosphatase PAP2 family protein [Acidobacteriia bacterium]|nr:phosphatase PAP2 family protein [Terriglobia bacterium]